MVVTHYHLEVQVAVDWEAFQEVTTQVAVVELAAVLVVQAL
jgi:hypothetical protein